MLSFGNAGRSNRVVSPPLLSSKSVDFGLKIEVQSPIPHQSNLRPSDRLTLTDPVLGFRVKPHLWGEVWHVTRRDELGA